MRVHLATVFILGSLTVSAQQPQLLDLTIPFDGPKVVAGGRFVTSTGPLPVTVAIAELPDQTYVVGESFQYEVTLTNNTSAAVTIPWSADASWLNNASPSTLLKALIGLELGSGADRTRLFAGAVMYGDTGSLASVTTLAPGASVRIRASGQWTVPGMQLRDFLAPSNGRVDVRASYHLTHGARVALAPVSEPRSVTLVMPHR